MPKAAITDFRVLFSRDSLPSERRCWYGSGNPTHCHQKGQLDRKLRNDAIAAVHGALWGILSVFFTMKVFGK